jgi:hypothetical protein
MWLRLLLPDFQSDLLTSWAIIWIIVILWWEGKLVLCAKADKMFMRIVQQNMYLILNSVPVTFELIRPVSPIIKHFLGQKFVAKLAKARKCTAEILAGNIQTKVERQHSLMISISVIIPARSNLQSCNKMCAISPHHSSGMMSLVWS